MTFVKTTPEKITFTQVFRHNRPSSVWTCLCVCYMDYVLTARQLRASIKIMHSCNKWHNWQQTAKCCICKCVLQKPLQLDVTFGILGFVSVALWFIFLMQHCIYLFIYLFIYDVVNETVVRSGHAALNDMKVSPLEKKRVYFIKTQSVPHSKHTPPRLYRTNPLMLYKAKVAVCSENYTQHIKSMWVPFWMLNPVVRKVTARLQMVSGWRIGRDVEGSTRGLFWGNIPKLPWGTQIRTKNPCPEQHQNWSLP